MKFIIGTQKGFVEESDATAPAHVKTFTHDIRHALAFSDVQTAQEYADRKYAGYDAVVLGDMTQQEYTFYWLSGTHETLKGTGPNDALKNRGYGGGAMVALDFYEEGKFSGKYAWDGDAKTWVTVANMIIEK